MLKKRQLNIISLFLLAGLLILTACFEVIDDKDTFDSTYDNGTNTPNYNNPNYTKANTIAISGLNLLEGTPISLGLFENEDQVNMDFADTMPEIFGSRGYEEQTGIVNFNLYHSNSKNWDGGGLWYVGFRIDIYEEDTFAYKPQYYISKSSIDFTSNKDQKIDFSEFKKYAFRITAGSIAELKSINISASGITLDELMLDFNCMTYAQMLEEGKLKTLYKDEEKTQTFNGGDKLYSDTKIYGEVDIMPLLQKDGAHITGTITLTDVPDNFYRATIHCEKGSSYLFRDPNNSSKYRWSITIYDQNFTASEYSFYLNVSLYDNTNDFKVPIQTTKYIVNKNAYVGDLGTVSIKSILVSGTVSAVVNKQQATYIEVEIKTPQGLIYKENVNVYIYPPDYPEDRRSPPSWSVRLAAFSSPSLLSFNVTVKDKADNFKLLYTRELSAPVIFVSNEDVSGVSLYVSDTFAPVNVSPLTENTWIHDKIESITEVDWYSLEVTKGTTYYFWWNDRNQGDGSKTAIIYADAFTSGAYKASDGEKFLTRSGSGTWNNSAVYTAVSSGTVYIKVYIYSTSYIGTYAICYSTNNSKPVGGNTTYTVTFNSNGGNGTVSPISTLSESYITLPSADSLTRNGYVLVGWFTYVNGSETTSISPGDSYKVVGNVTMYAKWILVYIITFDKNTAAGTVPSSLFATALTNYVVPLPYAGELSKDGYTFGGWNTKADGTGTNYSAGVNYTAGSNVTLYAKWKYNGPGIPLTANEWKDGFIYSDTFNKELWYSFNVTSGTTYNIWWSFKSNYNYNLMVMIDAFNTDGSSIFSGLTHNVNNWTIPESFTATSTGIVKLRVYPHINSSGNESIGSFSVVYNAGGSNPTDCTVTFDSNGGSGTVPPPITVGFNTQIIFPSGDGLSKDDYVFGGWCLDPSGGGIVRRAGYSLYITGNETYYAKWTYSYTVTFDSNGGSGTVPPVSVYSGESIPLPGGDLLSKDGYVFGGWNTRADGMGTSYNVNYNYVVNNNVTLYAKWNSVSLGGEGNPIPLTANEWKDGNITFSTQELWYSFNVTNGTTYYIWWNDVNQGNSTKRGDVVVGARYENSTYFIIGGSDVAIDKGWTTAQSFTANQTGNIYIRVIPYNRSNSYLGTFSLVYSTSSTRPTSPFIVTFDSNGGEGTVPYMSALPGTSITLPGGDGLTKGIYVFDGWTTNTNGTGTYYSAGSSYTVNGNVTLYAKWNVRYRVSYLINGGEGTVPPSIIVYPGTSITLPGGDGLIRSGYVFGGWNTKADGTGTSYKANSSYNVSDNVILYVKWKSTALGGEGNPISLTSNIWREGEINSSNQEIWYSINVIEGTTYNIWWNDSVNGNDTKTGIVAVGARYENDTGFIFGGTVTEERAGWYTPKKITANQTGKVYIRVIEYAHMGFRFGTFSIVYTTEDTRPGS